MKLKGFTVLTPNYKPLGFYDHQTPEGAVAEALIDHGHEAEPASDRHKVDLVNEEEDTAMVSGRYKLVEVPSGDRRTVVVG